MVLCKVCSSLVSSGFELAGLGRGCWPLLSPLPMSRQSRTSSLFASPMQHDLLCLLSHRTRAVRLLSPLPTATPANLPPSLSALLPSGVLRNKGCAIVLQITSPLPPYHLCQRPHQPPCCACFDLSNLAPSSPSLLVCTFATPSLRHTAEQKLRHCCRLGQRPQSGASSLFASLM